MKQRCILLGAALLAVSLEAQQYRITTIAGSDPVRDGGPAIRAIIESPAALTLDRDGTLYIADASAGRIRKITPDSTQPDAASSYARGVIRTVAGSGGSSFSGDGGPAVDAHLASPTGIAVDDAGNLYIADTNNNRIRVVTADGVIRTIAGTGRLGSSGDGGPAVEAAINVPSGIAVDSNGVVYIAELGGNRVRRINTDGTIETFAGGGGLGLEADGGPAAAARLLRPSGLAVDASNHLYIAESGRNVIRRVTPDGIISTTAGTGVMGSSGDGGPAVEAQLSLPRALTVDGTGRVWFTDSGNSRLRFVDPNGVIGAFGPRLPVPAGIALDQGGNVLVAFSLPIESAVNLMRPGSAGSAIGTPIAGASFKGDDGVAALDSLLHSPSGLTTTVDGRLLVAQRQQNVVRAVGADALISRFSGDGAGNSGDGGPAEQARLNGPMGLAADVGGNAYIVDSGNGRIRRVDAQGVIDTISGNTTLLNPLWIATDGSGNVFYSEPLLNRVRRIAPDGSIETVAGIGDTKLNNPQGVAADREGNLYIADSGNSAVLKLAADGTITTLAAGLPSPQGVAVDGEGNVLVTARHKVYRIAVGGEVAHIAGGDVPGFSGDDGPALEARFNQVGAICVDGTGAIYVADTGNHRIRKLSVE